MDSLFKHLKESWELMEIEDQDPAFLFLRKYEDKKVYVRFAEESDEKIIKMKSGAHGDPTGTYAFPIKYVISNWKSSGTFFGLKNIQIIQDTSKNKLILNRVRKYSTAVSILEKMGINIQSVLSSAEKRVRQDFMIKSRLYNLEKDTISPVLFFRLSQIGRSSDEQRKLWLKAGYDCLEDNGKPIVIHPDEPQQIVFLTLNSYKVLDTYTKTGNKEKLLRKFISKLYESLGERITKYESKESEFTTFKQKVIKTLGYEHSITLIYKPEKDGKYNIHVSIYGPKVSVDFNRDIFKLEKTDMNFNDLLQKVIDYYGLEDEVTQDKLYYSKQEEL